MTELNLTQPASLALQAGIWLSCGSLIGALHFSTLQRTIGLFVAGRALLPAIALQLGRMAFLAGTLAVIVSRFGPLSLLLAAAGILIGRSVALQAGESRD